jgi:2-iminoacetate synthase
MPGFTASYSSDHERDRVLRMLKADGQGLKRLYRAADLTRRRHMGEAVYLRGIVEFSNICRNNCLYCGIRAGNDRVRRYRLTPAQIMAVARRMIGWGQTTIVLQSGEAPSVAEDRELGRLIRRIKSETPLAVTLSVGNRPPETYRFWRDCGMDRYLLRFETSDQTMFSRLHPDCSLKERLACLHDLRSLGVQTGSGFMIGIPGETQDTLADNILLCRDLNLDMIGIGPFIAHPDTPLGGEANAYAQEPDMYFKALAVLRLLNPKAHLPATTAFDAVFPRSGRNLALKRGANVFMPNATPRTYRTEYLLYPGKPCVDEGGEDCAGCVVGRLRTLGRPLGMGPGHSAKCKVFLFSGNATMTNGIPGQGDPKGPPKECATMGKRLGNYDSDFINEPIIHQLLHDTAELPRGDIEAIIEKASGAKGLTPKEVAALIQLEDQDLLNKVFATALAIKKKIYGKRLVLFAPLYISSYCVNDCAYCGYHCTGNAIRKKLTMEEIRQEVEAIEELGHKRLMLDMGEDPVRTHIEYVLEAMKTIYETLHDNGAIRRINVQIAATTVEEYRMLKAAGIGTYVLFQETFHRETYAKMHKGPKRDYDWHATALARAMEGGIDDVGTGVLYGLYDYRFEVVAQMFAVRHLEQIFGVGPHTISVPRMRAAKDVNLETFPYLVTDDQFKKIVAVLRLAVPYTGMIISTREEPYFRDQIIDLGISQMSSGSCVGVGGYKKHLDAIKSGLTEGEPDNTPQFQVGDHRTPDEILRNICLSGYIPSYCTACYRKGRTGDRFMALAKTGQIQNICQPNALLTLKEYLMDYATPETRTIGNQAIEKHLADIPDPAVREKTVLELKKIENGVRDLYF